MTNIESRNWRLTDAFAKRVRAIYDSMAESVGEGFSDSDLRGLHAMIDLAADFYEYLTSADMKQPNEFYLEFACESIFAGIEFFTSVTRSYNCLVDTIDSKIDWGANPISSLQSLKEQYLTTYSAFEQAVDFEHKCRLLLHLYQMQLVFAGMSFDGIRQQERAE